MNRIFYQQDCDLQKLSGKTVAIIGYGSQGHRGTKSSWLRTSALNDCFLK